MRRMDEIDTLFFWGNLRKHFCSVILAGLGCGIAAFLICQFLVPPTYKADISLFAWGDLKDNGKSALQGPGSDQPERAMTYQDITFGSQVVNDYRELLNSDYVHDRVCRILDRELPALAGVPFRFHALVLNNTRFIKVSVYCHSQKKAEVAARTIAVVFMEAVRDIMGINRVQVVDTPKEVLRVAPRTSMISALAVLLGAGLLFGFFCLWEFFHHTLRNSDIVTRELDLPTLGTIGVCTHNPVANLACKPGEDSDHYKYNHIVEDFLLLQTNLQYSLPQKSGAQVIALTSAFPKDGKSFTSLNLALTLSGNSKRVLLINCDLRKAEYDYLDLPRQPGLVNFLLGEKKIEEIVNKNVVGTTLSVIRSGPIPPNPTRLLEIFQNSGALEKLAPDYDYIILDSPPCMNMADPLLLSKLADGTIIVADSRRTPVEAVRHAVEQLQKFHINILGMVLNRYAVSHSGYGYGYGDKQSGKNAKNDKHD